MPLVTMRRVVKRKTLMRRLWDDFNGDIDRDYWIIIGADNLSMVGLVMCVWYSFTICEIFLWLCKLYFMEFDRYACDVTWRHLVSPLAGEHLPAGRPTYMRLPIYICIETRLGSLTFVYRYKQTHKYNFKQKHKTRLACLLGDQPTCVSPYTFV